MCQKFREMLYTSPTIVSISEVQIHSYLWGKKRHLNQKSEEEFPCTVYKIFPLCCLIVASKWKILKNALVFITPNRMSYCSQELVPELFLIYTNTVIVFKTCRGRTRINKQGNGFCVEVHQKHDQCAEAFVDNGTLLENKECLVFLMLFFLTWCSLY